MKNPFALSTLGVLVVQSALAQGAHHSPRDARGSSIARSPAMMLSARAGNDTPQWEKTVNCKRAEREALLPSK